MLKFIGDFEKLKDYGFVERTFKVAFEKVIEQDEYHECVIRIHKPSRLIELVNEQHEEMRWMTKLDTLYDLIKDGLVIKEDERC